MKTNIKHDLSAASVFETIETETQDISHLAADLRRSSGLRATQLQQIVSAKLDNLLQLLLDQFRGNISKQNAKELLKEHYPLTRGMIAKLPPEGVPLVVVRELITTHLVPINRTMIPTWSKFFQRYQHAV